MVEELSSFLKVLGRICFLAIFSFWNLFTLWNFQKEVITKQMQLCEMLLNRYAEDFIASQAVQLSEGEMV
jgi:hypothetical protein